MTEDIRIKCILTLINEGKNQKEIAEYYNVAQSTISDRIKELKEL